jgi:hypothetical protein
MESSTSIDAREGVTVSTFGPSVSILSHTSPPIVTSTVSTVMGRAGDNTNRWLLQLFAAHQHVSTQRVCREQYPGVGGCDSGQVGSFLRSEASDGQGKCQPQCKHEHGCVRHTPNPFSGAHRCVSAEWPVMPERVQRDLFQ